MTDPVLVVPHSIDCQMGNPDDDCPACRAIEHEPDRRLFARHLPHRGSDVEAWLKSWRDEFEGLGPWHAFDAALDDYRLRADTGVDLTTPREALGP